MPFIPHTPEDVREMLDTIGVGQIEDLFDEIPAELRARGLSGVPSGLPEMEVTRLMQERAAADGTPLCFAGAGVYDHHIPAAVWQILSRGEFYSAYTPYQAEASQGTLQVIYEYQSMMTALTALEVSNASLYDGASALAEAVLMAVRVGPIGRRSARGARGGRILMPRTVHPIYRRVVDTIVSAQGIILEEVDYDRRSGHIDPASLTTAPEDFVALVVPQPNFFGVLEEVDALTDWAHAHGGRVIALVNPVSLALLKPPGEWGTQGADIACGEGQPLGAPLSSGGPYFGFMTCRRDLVRQLPGRIVGRTVDVEGKPGFTLTLQAREQHIRRSKATSNICTNQGLMMTAATIHLSLLGPSGLERVAEACHANTRILVERLTSIEGVERVFDRAVFHEAALRLPVPVGEAVRALAAQNLVAGYPLGHDYPELGESLLVCATEQRTSADIETYFSHLHRILTKRRAPACPTRKG
ncbi:putative glycine dehydrogenase (decarboxylating) subunit 1 [Gammaproteobacteria bacterium]